jgi:Domain of unknown function (DUF4287)
MPAKSPYSVHPSIAYVQSVIAKFKTKTGRTIDEWVEFVNKDGPKSEGDRRTWLKERHQLGTNYAWWIAERSVGKGEDDSDPAAYLRKAPQYVAEMFAGKRAGLKPIYNKLLGLACASVRRQRSVRARRLSRSTASTSSPKSSQRRTAASISVWHLAN